MKLGLNNSTWTNCCL